MSKISRTLGSLFFFVALAWIIPGAGRRLTAQDNGQQGDQTQTGQSGQTGQTGQTGKTDNNTTQKKKGGGLFGGIKKITGTQGGDETTTTASAGGKAIGEGKAIGDAQPTAADREAVLAMERYSVAAADLKRFQSDGKLEPQK